MPPMNNLKISAKGWAQNSALSIFSLVFILAMSEWLFPKFLDKIPFQLYGGLETELRVLAQYSKQSVLPQNYIALVGDSNSVGVGDLYIDSSKSFRNWYPEYSPAHFISKNVGRDVVSFGFAGAGSLDGIWSGPITQFKHINANGFDLTSPKTILILFYEGNDLNNSLQFIRENYDGNEDIPELLQSAKFNEWLNLQFRKPIDETQNGLEKKYLFIKFSINSVNNLISEKFKQEGSVQHIIFPTSPITQAIVNGKVIPLPVNLQAPPTFRFSPFDKSKGHIKERLKVGYYIFEKATKTLKEFFPESDIKIIYLPSVLSTYKIVSSVASFRTNMGKGGIVDSKKLIQRHLEVCQEIFKISQRLKVGFFDTTLHLRNASSKGYIHGPIDWDHLNESGYRALSDGISQFILHPDEPYPRCLDASS
jgi:hypothetical protein